MRLWHSYKDLCHRLGQRSGICMGHRHPGRGVTQSRPPGPKAGRRGTGKGVKTPRIQGHVWPCVISSELTIPSKCHQLGVMIPFISHGDQIMENDMR